MAGLYDRTAHVDGVEGLNNHLFSALIRLRALGVTQVTRQYIIDLFALTGAEIADFDAMVAEYQSRTANGKRAYLIMLNDMGIVAESEKPDGSGKVINEVQWRAVLGL